MMSHIPNSIESKWERSVACSNSLKSTNSPSAAAVMNLGGIVGRHPSCDITDSVHNVCGKGLLDINCSIRSYGVGGQWGRARLVYTGG